MTVTTNPFVNFIGEPLSSNDARIDEFLRIVESATGEHIDKAISGSSFMPRKISGERVAFISQWLTESNNFGTPGTLTNGLSKQQLLITIKNMRPIDESMPPGPGSFGPTVSSFEVWVDEETGFHPALSSRFAELALKLKAYWGVLHLPRLSQQINRSKARYQQMLKWATHPKQVERLEHTKHEYIYEIESRPMRGIGPGSVWFKAYLQWTNYWCDAMAASLRFPDLRTDKPLEGLYERVDDAGWIVRLTKDQTDLDNPDHLAQVRRAYKRFGTSDGNQS